jgi:hypothetical protein
MKHGLMFSASTAKQELEALNTPFGKQLADLLPTGIQPVAIKKVAGECIAAWIAKSDDGFNLTVSATTAEMPDEDLIQFSTGFVVSLLRFESSWKIPQGSKWSETSVSLPPGINGPLIIRS